jgi:NADH-ubiquinone oxidoreductase chain 1
LKKINIKTLMLQILYLLLEGLSVIVPALLAVAFMTIIERKALAATQRRVGPNTVGYYGVLQPLNLREVIILSII